MKQGEKKLFAPIFEWVERNCIRKKTIDTKQFWKSNYNLKQRATRETGFYVDSYQFHLIMVEMGYNSRIVQKSKDPESMRWIYNIL